MPKNLKISKLDNILLFYIACDYFFFIFYIYSPFTRKRIALLYFGLDVSTRLGVAIFEVYVPPVFHVKVGCPVKCLAQGHNKRTCLFVRYNTPQMPSAKQGSCGYYFVKSFGMTRQGDWTPGLPTAKRTL